MRPNMTRATVFQEGVNVGGVDKRVLGRLLVVVIQQLSCCHFFQHRPKARKGDTGGGGGSEPEAIIYGFLASLVLETIPLKFCGSVDIKLR